jgi:membrane protease YdiL (CAAX protease family)
MRDWFRRQPLVCFSLLAFLLSWYPWLLSFAGVKTSGGMNPLGILVAALIVTGIARGWAGIKELLRKLVLWKVRWIWYAFVILFPILACSVSTLLNVFVFGAPTPEVSLAASWKNLVEQFIFIFLFIGLGEEPGWRGFALPRLQNSRSPLKASLILAVFWAIWHVPLFGIEFTNRQIAPFLISVFAATVILTWIYNHTRGSVLIPMIFHAAVNTIGAGYFFRMFTGTDLNRIWWIYTIVWVFTATIVILVPSSGLLEKRAIPDRRIGLVPSV